MRSFATLSALVAFVAPAMAQLMVNTPANLVQCVPAALSWSGGVAPYFLSIIPAGNPSAAALENLGQQTGTTYTWIVNLPVGTDVSLSITDSSGVINYSSNRVIMAGTSSACTTGVVAGATAVAPAAGTSRLPTSASAAVAASPAGATVAAAATTPAAAAGSSTSAAAAAAATTAAKSSASALTFSSLASVVVALGVAYVL